MTSGTSLAESAVENRVQELVQEGDALLTLLESFGWPDSQPDYIEEAEIQTLMLSMDPNKVKAKKRIPSEFAQSYHKWYSGCLSLVEANAPSRVAELVQVHQSAKTMKFLDVSMLGLLQKGYMNPDDQNTAVSNITHIKGIVDSIAQYLRSKIYDIELVISRTYAGDQLVEAEALLLARYTRAAGALAGVTLERHLKMLCAKHQPPLNYGKGDIGSLNSVLIKNLVYDQQQWAKVNWMKEVRDTCDHASTQEPRKEGVEDLIKEVGKFIALFSA